MKRKLFLTCFAAMAALAMGCSDDSSNESVDSICGHGKQNADSSCVCDQGYKLDSTGGCNDCAAGYTETNDGRCTNGTGEGGGEGGGSDPIVSSGCKTTITYKNTNYKSNNVYLIGDFNSWGKEDANYKFDSDGNGNFTLVIDGEKNSSWAKNKTPIFKVYIGGGLNDDEAYRSVPSVCTVSDDKNCTLNVTCGQKFAMDEDAGTGGVTGGGSGGGQQTQDGCKATFVYYNPDAASVDVYIAGTMNNWAEGTDPNYKMTSDGSGTHTIVLDVTQGTVHKFKYYIPGWNDPWVVDAANNETDPSENNNMVANIASCGMTFGKGGSGQSSNPTGGSGTVNGKEVVINLDSACRRIIEGGSGNAKCDGNTVKDTVEKYGKYVYKIETDSGEVYAPMWVEEKAWDWHRALLYFAFTDRFMDGNPSNNNPKTDASYSGGSDARWMGGDFAGLQKKVEEGYFDRLGVNTLWISSVSMNTQRTSNGTGSDAGHSYSAYHSYWPISTFMHEGNQGEFAGVEAIEPHFGTMQELTNLVQACHERGIRVLVDFAANHVHLDSPMFQKHPDWFNDKNSPQLCDSNNNWDNYSEKCWFSADLPDINYEHSEARDTMVKHAVWLIKQTGIDGFRVDAVKHMNIQFVKDLRAATDKLFKYSNTFFYMVGETFTGDVGLLNKYIGDDMLHAQFDFPLYYKLGNILTGGGFYDIAHNGKSNFKSDLMGTFMGNHDVARAISVAAKQNTDKWGNNDVVTDSNAYLNMKTAWTILLTQPGVPLIYYGDEYGMPGANDPDNRRMMQFDGLNGEQAEMLKFVQALGQARKAHPALSMGTRRDLKAEENIWCYEMSKDGETLIVALGHGPGGKCELGGTKQLLNVLDPDAAPFDASEIDATGSKLNVFLVK